MLPQFGGGKSYDRLLFADNIFYIQSNIGIPNRMLMVPYELRHLSFLGSLIFIFLLQGCGSNDGDKPGELTLSPVSTIFGLDKSVQLTALLDGETVSSGLSWSSSDALVGTVSASGLFTSRKQGSTTITVRSGDLTASTDVEVFNATGEGVESIDLEIKDFMQRYEVPGASYSVVKNGQLVMTRGYGVSDITTQEPVTPQHIFRVASVSKSITAAAILKLVDQGQLNLSDKLFDILEEYVPNTPLFDQRILQITIEQLLHHTSGSDLQPQPLFNQGDIAAELSVDSPPSVEDIMRWFVFKDMQFDPGTTYRYHNMNYFLLGRVIEKLSGMSYEDFVIDKILSPLGITDTHTTRTRKSERHSNEVTYYEPGSQLLQSIFPGEGLVQGAYGGWGAFENIDAAGGWVISSVDLSRFALAIDGVLGDNEVLSADSQDFMRANGGFGYGGGLFTVTGGGWFHEGGLPGSGSLIWSNGNGLIITMMFNATPPFLTPESNSYFNEIRSDLTGIASLAELEDQDLFGQY